MNPSVCPELPIAALRSSQPTHAAVDNPQPAEIALKKPLRTVLTSGATSMLTDCAPVSRIITFLRVHQQARLL